MEMIVYICGGYFEDFVICEISLVRFERPAPTSFFCPKNLVVSGKTINFAPDNNNLYNPFKPILPIDEISTS